MLFNTIPFTIIKKLIKKIRSAGIRLNQTFTSIYLRLLNIFTTTLTDKYWLIDYLPQQKSVRETLLLVRLDLIGDFIIWLDAAKEFKKLYPDKRIVLYANSAWAPLAERLAYWDEVVSIDMTRLRADDAYRLKLLYRTHFRGFDISIQPTYSREYVSDLVVRASKAPQRIGQLGDVNNINPERKAVTDTWYTRLVPQGIFPEIELNINAELIRALGHSDFKSRLPYLERRTELPPELVIASEYCVIVPGASWEPKMWPAANFAELARKINQNRNLKIVLCGTQSERTICNRVAELSGVDVINLAGLTTLLHMIEIIRNASLLVANDSASVHIGAVTRTPSVCILGGGHFGRFLPYEPEIQENNHPSPKVIFNKLDCYGCRWRCHYPLIAEQSVPCISGVDVSQVLEECCSLFVLEND
jgi:ADP-heptose:LPS heptosyltransferase